MDMVAAYTFDRKAETCEFRAVNFDENFVTSKLISFAERLESLEEKLKTSRRPGDIDLTQISKELNTFMSDVLIHDRYKIKEKNKASISKQVNQLLKKFNSLLKFQSDHYNGI